MDALKGKSVSLSYSLTIGSIQRKQFPQNCHLCRRVLYLDMHSKGEVVSFKFNATFQCDEMYKLCSAHLLAVSSSFSVAFHESCAIQMMPNEFITIFVESDVRLQLHRSLQ